MAPKNNKSGFKLESVPFLTQFLNTLETHREATRFIIKHKLWNGFWKYGWVARLLIGVAILFGLKFVSIFMDWLDHFKKEETANAFVEMGLLMESVALESYNFLFTGSLKYIMLILLEVIIFHVCRRTMEILTGKSSDLTFNTFLKAQKRMIKVVIRTYFMEMAFTLMIKITFGIFGTLEFLEPVFIFAVQCYFLGFVVLDNYNEQFELNIKESAKYAKQFIGVSLAVGLILNIVLMIPAIGAIIGPMIAAVAVTLVMFKISDLHLEEPPELSPADEFL